MNALNLCDLLTQSTSFTREMCQKLSRDLTEIFEKTHRRPSFAKFVNRSGWNHSGTDAFLKLVHQAFQEPPAALGPGVYGIINLTPRDDVGHLALRAQEMVNGGVAVVQLRPKNCDTSLIREAAALIQPILQPHNIPFVLNDQAQEAAYLAADGVHVGQTDMPPQTIGHQYPELIVGHSTHTLTQATQAQEDPAVHWVALGPIFESPTKKGHADIVGLESLAERVYKSKTTDCNRWHQLRRRSFSNRTYRSRLRGRRFRSGAS